MMKVGEKIRGASYASLMPIILREKIFTNHGNIFLRGPRWDMNIAWLSMFPLYKNNQNEYFCTTLKNLLLHLWNRNYTLLSEAPAAIFLVRISAKILSISENFCQNSV